MKYLGAITLLGNDFPAYVNLSQDDDGEVVITVREEGGESGEGRTVSMKIPSVCAEMMLKEAQLNMSA